MCSEILGYEMNDFEVHDRGTARELKLLRELVQCITDNHQHMVDMNCYAQSVRIKYAELMRFYKEQELAGSL